MILDEKLTCRFRKLDRYKPRIIKLVDQTSDEQKIKEATSLAIINGKDIKKHSLRKEYLKKYTFHQMQLCKNVSVLEPCTLPQLDQIMDNDQTILSFLLQQQNQTMMTEDPLLFDFKAPLEFEIILLKDSQT